MRAVEIRVASDLSATPGDHVDVLVTAKQGATRIVLHNVKVVAADQNIRVVTFLLSPDDAQKAAAADGQGKFSLRLWKSN
jgi:Flp pilus assembly protein CpaB